jgi:hypothetical protein
MVERSWRFPPPPPKGVLPLELGATKAAAAYVRRFLALVLATSVALTFIGVYVAIYKLGMRSIPLLAALVLGAVLSFVLTLLEEQYAGRYSGLHRRVVRLPQAARYPIERLLALVALIISAPTFLIISLLVRFDSEGPILVRMTKVGRFGRPFTRLTFRTVSLLQEQYDEGNPQSKAQSAWQMTRVGGALRRSSLDKLPMLINVVKGEMALFGEPAQAPDDLLASGALYLPRLVRRPGVVRVQHEANWSVRVPPLLSKVAAYLQTAITEHRHEKNSKVLLLQIRHADDEGPERCFVLTFWVAGANEPEIRSHLKELGVSDVDVLVGSASQSAALIEAAWTAWCDLPHRHTDEPLRQLGGQRSASTQETPRLER